MTRSGQFRTTIDIRIAHDIKALRLKAGMSRRKLGKKIGVAQSMVGKFEDPNVSRITAGRLAQLADAFGIHPDYFFRKRS